MHLRKILKPNSRYIIELLENRERFTLENYFILASLVDIIYYAKKNKGNKTNVRAKMQYGVWME